MFDRLAYKVTPSRWKRFLLFFKPSHYTVDPAREADDPWCVVRWKKLGGVIYVLDEDWV